MAPKIPAAGMPETDRGFPQEDRGDALYQFGQCASVLRDVLYDDKALDDEEFIFIDKHFQILQLAYLRWKRKHRPSDDSHSVI
ncbi:MAG TPA: hypothetical protein VJL88_07530 [Nitrospira sp.]|nr:hypothetical protein [Nitrospira sp.]